MKIPLIIFLTILLATAFSYAQTISDATQSCIDCHESIQPGIVQDWLSSRHAKMTPAEALKKTKLERRISNESVPAELASTVVGCF
ncbi:MAG: hydroxylamine oxidase, partial [candidate division KSB1 bacterium]|nr:hydroxylamine oxidase [candidate division KSB1 bacterium]